jgi:hypothetical protein
MMNRAAHILVKLVTGVLAVVLGLGIMSTDNPISGQLLGVALFVGGAHGLQELVQEWS